MLVKYVSGTLVGFVCLAWAIPAEAQGLIDGFRGFGHSVFRDWQRNNCYPEPFLRPDRNAVRTPFVLMVHNGWRRQNLLNDYHFEKESSELNEAGQLKVRWILTAAPRHHRTIYVHRSGTPEEAAARIAAVQEFGAHFAEEGVMPEVFETTIDPLGWSADRVNMIGRRWVDSTPAPRLPQPGSGSETSN